MIAERHTIMTGVLGTQQLTTKTTGITLRNLPIAAIRQSFSHGPCSVFAFPWACGRCFAATALKALKGASSERSEWPSCVVVHIEIHDVCTTQCTVVCYRACKNSFACMPVDRSSCLLLTV